MLTNTLTSFRTLFAIAVIGLGAVVGLAATTSPASALPRDSNDLIENCESNGGILHVQVVVVTDGTIVADYMCLYDYGVERCTIGNGASICYQDFPGCTDVGGGEEICFDGGPEPEPDPDPTAGEPSVPVYGIPMTDVITSYQTFEPSSSLYGGYTTSTAGAYAAW